MKKQPYESDHEYIPHQICPRCRLNLSQDICVCGWKRPRPDKEQAKNRSSDWPFRIIGFLLVGAAVYWLVTQLGLFKS